MRPCSGPDLVRCAQLLFLSLFFNRSCRAELEIKFKEAKPSQVKQLVTALAV
jgi:hypothetical protein